MIRTTRIDSVASYAALALDPYAETPPAYQSTLVCDVCPVDICVGFGDSKEASETAAIAEASGRRIAIVTTALTLCDDCAVDAGREGEL